MFEPVKKGDTGDNVMVMQAFLYVLQYTGEDDKPISIDGSCGDNTVAAINKFQEAQRRYGIECGTDGQNDGVFGKACWERIGLGNV